jgi:hypothetical protein
MVNRAEDQAFSFTDYSSFCIMRRQGLVRALTRDRHFAVEGFVPLLGLPRDHPARVSHRERTATPPRPNCGATPAVENVRLPVDNTTGHGGRLMPS